MIAGRDDLVPVHHDPEVDLEAWLESRRLGLGGSDVPAVVNEHPQKSAGALWLEKTSEFSVERFDNEERCETGKQLEPVVLEWFARGGKKWPRHGDMYTIVKPPSVFRRDKPWQRASADGFVYYPEAIVDVAWVGGGPSVTGIANIELLTRKPSALAEVKTHGWFGSRGYSMSDDGDPIVSVPPDKRIQCAWYMALYDVDTTYLVCLIDTHLKRTFTIRRDLEIEAMLLDATDRFWHGNVLADVPPDPDGSDSYRKFLGNRYRTHGRDIIEATEPVDLAIEALLAIKRDQKVLEKDRELAEQVVKSHIGDNEGVKSKHGLVTWRSQASGKLREKQARQHLYEALGWTDSEIHDFEDKYKQPDHRVLRTPK